jgi:hypothetical protein
MTTLRLKGVVAGRVHDLRWTRTGGAKRETKTADVPLIACLEAICASDVVGCRP